jgi:galactose mutarotase-like enzyme
VRTSDNGPDYIWQALEVWPRHAPILFPIVGSLRDGEYLLNGKTYALNHHGFARDLDFDCLQQSQHSITLLLKENTESLLSYPFRFRFLLTYTLQNQTLIQRFRIQNRSDESMPVSFGAHTAFNAKPIDDFQIRFEKEEDSARELMDVPLISRKKKSLLNGNTLSLSRDTFEEDALIFTDLKSRKVSLQNRNGRSIVDMEFRDWPYLGIWAKPSAPFVCLEPWQGLADYTDHNKAIWDKKGIHRLEPGTEIEKSIYYHFHPL